MLFTALALVLIAIAVFFYLRSPVFGRPPAGARLERIRRSPQYRDGQFQNSHPTPQLSEGFTYRKVMTDFFFTRHPGRTPAAPFPVRRTDLKALAPAENVLVWFGHSSYFLQVNGKRFLIDPVLSGNASPVRWTTRAFSGSDVYTVDDLPDIDYLLLSHDHYDHLDYRTVKSLQPRVGRVITGLGVGAHLEHWGYSAQQVRELDWFEDLELTSGFLLQALPARHFSGRQFRRNNTLWVSFALTTPSFRLYLGGDSGYGDHFKTIGERCGPFDLALLENGQYNAAWKYIHMMPEEVAQAAADLQARRLMPVHWGKFALSTHTWQEPITRVTAAAREKGIPLLHPMIGEPVHLDAVQEAAEWWRGNS